MQKISDILPSSETLEKISGVEEQLRKRRRIGGFGWALLLLGSTIQIAAEINSLGILSIEELWKERPWVAGGLVAATLSIILALLLITWSTYWLKASKRPFRYTCSVGKFAAVGSNNTGGKVSGVGETMHWLPQDLQRLLNERVQRFGFLDAGPTSAGNNSTEAPADAHIHIHGAYIVRTSDECNNCVEVAAKIRIGPEGSPEVLAPTPPPVPLGADFESTRETYDDLLERVYHSVVSEVYRRLQEDVQRKIDLLPTRKLRVIALLHEADDYAQSNTLHAYDRAAELYGIAARMLEVSLRPFPEGALGRFFFTLRERISAFRRTLRRIEASYRPSVAEIDVLLARAMIGYALMQNIRLGLVNLVGDRSQIPRFEPLRYVDFAYELLRGLSNDVRDREDSLFRCLTVRAMCCSNVGDRKRATEWLEAARSRDPKRASEDHIYTYANAQIAPEIRTKLSILREAVDLDPRFELAQFGLAFQTEMLWRSRDTFEVFGAALVLDEYKKVTTINPGNLGGWANSGHVCWLVGNLQLAEEHFAQGIRYREIQKDAFISELQFGLARIYAEQGRIEEAYRAYVAAVSSMVSGPDYLSYFYEGMTPAKLERYKEYYQGFVTELKRQRRSSDETSTAEEKRLRNSVHAFVLYDLGRALHGASESFDADKATLRAAAIRKLRTASRRNPAFALPHFWISQTTSDANESRARLEKAIELEQNWSDAHLHLVYRYADAAWRAEQERESNKRNRDELADKEKELEEREARRPVWTSTMSGIAGEARPTGDALSHQYGVYVGRDHARPVKERATLAPETPRNYADSDEYRQGISDLKDEIAQLRSKIRADETIYREYRESADHYRTIAEQKLKLLIPHDWLWQGEQFNWAAVADRNLRKYMVWEREFTVTHANAVYFWALRYIYDKTDQRDKAILLLSLVRDRFWPADENVLSALLDINLQGTDDKSAKRRLIEAATDRNPDIIVKFRHLDRYGFSLDEEIEILGRLSEEMLPGDNAELVRQRHADALYRKAAESFERAEDIRKALGVEQTTERRTELRFRLAQLLTPSDDIAVVAQAIEHVSEFDQYRGRPNSELPLRALLADHARLQTRTEARGDWGEAGATFLDLKPPVRIRVNSDLRTWMINHRSGEGGTGKMLDDLHWGLYWELGVLFPRPVVELDANIEDDRYFIDLHGIELVTNKVRKDQRLINALTEDLDALGIESVHALNPANGRDCAFVEEHVYQERKSDLDQFGFSWDAFGFIVLHTAAVMRANADELLRVDDTVELLDFGGLANKRRALEANGQLSDLTNVLRAFAAEEIPINDLNQLVEVFEVEREKQHAGLTELAEAIRTHPDIRRRNKYVNQNARQFWPLGPSFTKAISEGLANGSGKVLAIEPAIAQDILTSVRDAVSNIQPGAPNPVIVARPEHRLWVKKLVELEFPHLWVLSEREAFPEHMDELGREIEI